MQRGRDKRGVGIQVRQNSRQARGEHRLTRSRLTQKKHVMPTGCSNLHRRNRLRLPANVRHIERQRIDNIRSLTAYPQPPVEWRLDGIAPGPRDEVGEVPKIKHLDAAN